jgi:DNA-binding transcriptional LysR family regulator
MDNRVDLNAVRVLVAVVEHGFRGAAQRLGLPRSTVSKKVADLEAALGQRLLTRTTRRAALTDVGSAFVARVTPALGSLAEAVDGVRLASEAPRGVLRITAPQTFAETMLADFLVEFAKAWPEVRLVLDLTDRFVDLVGGGYDVAIRAGALPDSSLRARLLTQNPIGCFASERYLARFGTPQTPAQLKDHDVLGFGTDRLDVKWAFAVRGHREVVTLRPRLTVNSFVLLVQLAEAGLGITRVPWPAVAPPGSRGRRPTLVEVLPAFAPGLVPMHAVYAPGRESSPTVRAFLDALVTRLELPGVRPSRR